MNEYSMTLGIAFAIAIVILFALYVGRKISAIVTRDSFSLTSSKDKEKDIVDVNKISESVINISTKSGQKISVSEVSDKSDVVIK